MKRFLIALGVVFSVFAQSWAAGRVVKSCDAFVVVVDESSSMHLAGEEGAKIDDVKNLLERINASVPQLDYRAALVGYNHNKEAESLFGYKIYFPWGSYSKGPFSEAVSHLEATRSYSSLTYGVEVAAKILRGKSGRVNVIFFSDGVDSIEYPKSLEETASRLKSSVDGKVCVYAVQVGESDEGSENLSRLVDLLGCGRLYSYSDVSGDIKGFVREVFGYVEEPKVVKVERPSVKDSDGDGVADDRDACPRTPKGARVDEEGCWNVGVVHFDLDKWDIKPEYIPVLEEVLKVMKMNPDLKIEIVGYTDSQSSVSYNLKLSMKRALSVKRWLCEHGVSCGRVLVRGMGESDPVADDSTQEGRARNRRVEFRVIR